MSKKGKAKRVFKYITDVISWTCLCILILIGALLVWYFISAKIYASKGEKYTPYFSLYTIISPSMEPNIKVYDVILDTRVDDVNTIKEGDIITFISSGNLSSCLINCCFFPPVDQLFRSLTGDAHNVFFSLGCK